MFWMRLRTQPGRPLAGLLTSVLLAPAATANVVADWGARYGDGPIPEYHFQEANAVGFDEDGNLYVAGQFEGYLDLGGGLMSAESSSFDIFVAKFTPDGQHLWSISGGGFLNENVNDMHVTPSGSVYVVGQTRSPIFSIDDDDVSTNGQTDAFAISLGPDGTHVWTQVWGGELIDIAHSVTRHGGSILISGTFRGTVDFGPGTPFTAQGFADFFLLEATQWGTTPFAVGFGGTGNETWTSIAADANGDIFFAGAFANTINLGNGPLTSQGGTDACLAKFPSVGEPATWSQAFGGPQTCSPFDVATDGSNLYVTGSFEDQANFGTGTLTSEGNADLWVGAYKSNGVPVWARRGGGADSEGGTRIVHFADQLFLAGWTTGIGTYGAFHVATAGGIDALMLVYDETGQVVDAKGGGGPQVDSANGIAVNADGICLVGGFMGTASFDDVELVNPDLDTYDVFMVSYVESTVGVEPLAGTASGLRLGPAYPNPLRTGTALAVRGAVNGRNLSALVADVTGRVVRRLAFDGAPSGAVRWDGRNASGTPVPAGVYFLSVEDGVTRARQRVTVLR